MFAALLTPVLFIAGSLAVDTANLMSMRTRLQNAADGAALATASGLAAEKVEPTEAKLFAATFFKGLVSEDATAFTDFSAKPTVTISSSGSGKKTVWQVEVDVEGSLTLTSMARLMGREKTKVAVSGTSQSARDASNPLSMMLVLDRSGSMAWASGQTTTETVPRYCYYYGYRYQCGTTTQQVDVPKIDVLKVAVANLVDHIKESDSTDEYARMGAVSYNFQTTSSDKLGFGWDKSKVTTFADALVAKDGTYAVDAMKWAYEQVTGSGEVNAHFSKNGSKNPTKFILFMTDGEHDTGSNSQNDYADKKTKEYCTSAKDKGTIIFAVAFQAPQRGKDLLSACASGNRYYYDANSASDLTKAFTDIGEEAVKLVTRLTM
ncbi:Flp pilus assembly protein TadG [Hoeflea marina]|uniref:Flp pilus assembly protein TadG n=1 Tax=Hoeflea marina TaxID=274592 RepID=A0A317PL02_9HYPH|nr:vWA domain-containing protein [Hoeflea marina]PWW01645.1 Flp pilus assembly protein TadG [Hoeflea marina]